MKKAPSSKEGAEALLALEADFFACQKLDILLLEDLCGPFRVGGLEDNAGMLFDLGDEGVNVFNIDGTVRQRGHNLGQAAGLVVDLDGEHVSNGNGAASGFERIAGFLRIADDKPQYAEFCSISHGDGADVNMVFTENIGDVGHAALLILDKNRDLLNLHVDHSLLMDRAAVQPSA